MKCKEVAELLLQTPDAELLARVNGGWVGVSGVRHTGEHRNAVTLNLMVDLETPQGGGIDPNKNDPNWRWQ